MNEDSQKPLSKDTDASKRKTGSLLKQPFLYAAAAGALVFIFNYLLTRQSDVVTLTVDIRHQVEEEQTRNLGRSPTPEELQKACRDWEDDEAFYREALSLGLEKNDPMIRVHLANKLRTVIKERTIPAPPTEDELETLFQKEGDTFETEPHYDVTLGYFANIGLSPTDARARAEAALQKLKNDEQPEDVSDHFPRGPVFSEQPKSYFDEVFKTDFESFLKPNMQGHWALISAPRGYFVFKLNAVHSGKPELEALRPALIDRFVEHKKQQALDAYTADMRRKYHVDAPSR